MLNIMDILHSIIFKMKFIYLWITINIKSNIFLVLLYYYPSDIHIQITTTLLSFGHMNIQIFHHSDIIKMNKQFIMYYIWTCIILFLIIDINTTTPIQSFVNTLFKHNTTTSRIKMTHG